MLRNNLKVFTVYMTVKDNMGEKISTTITCTDRTAYAYAYDICQTYKSLHSKNYEVLCITPEPKI